LESENGAGPVIFVEGVANLLVGEIDRDRLRLMLSALEAKQQLIELLNAYVDARQQTVRVVVGLEEARRTCLHSGSSLVLMARGHDRHGWGL